MKIQFDVPWGYSVPDDADTAEMPVPRIGEKITVMESEKERAYSRIPLARTLMIHDVEYDLIDKSVRVYAGEVQ